MKMSAMLLLIVSSLGFAQGPVEQKVPTGFQTHDGFYLSLAGGPAFGPITLEATNSSFKKMDLKGSGFQFDFKIGAVVSEESNLILSFDLIGRALSDPTVTLDGRSVTTSSKIQANDVMVGAGLTKYFMPSNVFVSATIGIGKFGMEYNNTNSSSQGGLGFQVKVGKEWWVSDDWGIGVAAGIAHISADDQKISSNPSYSGKLATSKFFVVFNSTFN